MTAAAGASDRRIAGELFRLALPVFASQILRLAYQWVDALWVRGLGVHATAAITTSVFVMWCVLSLNDIFGMGISAYVSQLIGAGDRARAGVAAYKGLKASALLGLAGTVLGLTASRAIFRLMDPTGAIVAEGAAYLRVVLLATPLLLLSLACESTLRAAGDTRTPFLIDLGAVGLNAVLNPFLIYGFGRFQGLGIAGAAWATVVSQCVMLACYLSLALRRHPSFPLARRAAGPPVRVLGLAKVGLPAALIGVLFSAVYVAFVRAASAYGAAAVAVVGIANRVEAIEFVVAGSIGLAGASLVGRRLGAGLPEEAAAVMRTGQRWAVGIALVLMAAYLVVPRLFLAMFTSDPAVFALGVPYLRVLAITLVATALEITTAECVMGSGHTAPVSRIYTVISLLRIPLAFLAPRYLGGGLMAIVWVITTTCIVRTAWILAWAARGTWKQGLAGELHGHVPGTSPGESGSAG